MPISTTEQTDTQRIGWWGRTWSRWTSWGRSSAALAVEGSGAIEGKNPYSPPVISVFAGPDTIDGRPLPGTFENYRAMQRDPTIALAMAAYMLSIMAAEWYAEIDDDLKDDPAALFGKEIIEADIIARRSKFCRDCLECLFFGFQAFETPFTKKTLRSGKPYTGITKLKPLTPDWTIAQIDDHGNLVSVKNGKATLTSGQFVWIVYNKIGDNWYGLALLENCRRAWSNTKTLEDQKMRLVRLGTGIILVVKYPPDSQENKDANRFPNRDIAIEMARNLSDGQSAAVENLTGLDAQQVIGNPDLAGKSNISVEPIDMGDPGPRLQAIGAEQDRLAKELVRGCLQPERTITEATMGGSRADSESHGDIALANAEATHESIVEQINEQPVATLIRENCGEQYVGRIRLVAAPIQDEQKRQLSAMWAALLTDEQFKASLVDSIGDEGLQTIIDRLGLGISLKDPFEPLVGDEPGVQTAATGNSDDDDADER